MDLYPSDKPSMTNVYESTFSDDVKYDEYRRSQQLYEKAKNPWKTGIVPKPADSSMFYNVDKTDEDGYVLSLTGEKIDRDNFKHNNMQPFLKGNVTQNTNIEKYTAKLDKDTGNDKLYFRKREVQNMFKPTAGYDNINGAKAEMEFLKSRIEPSKLYNNITPIAKTYVGPGLNKGYTTLGSGGYQQSETLDYARPKTLDELRSKVNQRENVFKIPYAAHVKGTDQRAKVMPFSKNKPEKTYQQTKDNWFKTTAGILKQTGRAQIAMKDSHRPDMHVEYTGPAALDIIQGVGIKDDYGKQNIIVYDNERNETQTRTVVSNLTSIVKAIVNPIADVLKLSMKEYLVDAPRGGGNPRAQIPEKATSYDPHNMPKTTVKETLLHDSDTLNLTGPDKSYSTNDDIAKTTVKETLLHDSDTLNLSGPDKNYSANDDIAKTTVKETLLHDSDTVNLTGPDKSYAANDDIAKTTVKETVIHDGHEYTIIKTANGLSYLRNQDNARKTTKETLPVQDTVRNVGKGTYRVYVYDPDRVVVKKTMKETTIRGKTDLGFIGGIINAILGGYATKEVDIKNTHKQFTSDNEEYGVAGAVYEHRQSSREAEMNAEIDGAREKMMIDAGHTPNPGGMNIPIDKQDINMKSNKLIEDSIVQREAGNINMIYQKPPELNTCSLTKDRYADEYNAYANRLDVSILDSLKSNEYSININPVK